MYDVPYIYISNLKLHRLKVVRSVSLLAFEGSRQIIRENSEAVTLGFKISHHASRMLIPF